MKVSRTWLLIALTMSLLALTWSLRQSASPAHDLVPQRVATSGAEAPVENGEATNVATDPGALRTAAATATAPATRVPTERARRLDDYANSRDLQAFVDSLLAAAEAGDGEAAGLIARAWDECHFAFVTAKTGHRMHGDPARLQEPERSIATAQLAINRQRCGRLVAGAMHRETSWAREQIKAWSDKARAGGDLGQLIAAGDIGNLELSSVDDNELLRRIAASGHDQAVEMLAMAIADAGGERDIQGPFSGTPADSVAWMLVACALGRDCEPNGRRMRDKCLMLDHCMTGSYRDYIRYYHATPWQFDEALKKERRILDLLKRGALDALFPLRPKPN